MDEFDLNTVAVIGSGPVGLACALALARSGVPVTLFESGPQDSHASWPDPSGAEIADPRTHVPMDLTTRRGFGGTSALWAGRAVPYDAIDFADRPWARTPAWPISFQDLAPWYEPASKFLNCGPASPPSCAGAADLCTDHLERWCAQPNIGAVKLDEVRAHPKIRIAANTTITRVHIDPERGHCTGLQLFRDGQSSTAIFRAVAITAGGVETTRLLLNSRIDHPALFGGPDGALGRYYMGHVAGSIADIVFTTPGGDKPFDYMRDDDGYYLRRRFSLSAAAQMRHQVLNMTAWPELPTIADPRHQSAISSIGYLALSMPIFGPRLVAPALRARMLAGGDGRILPHIANVLRNPFGAAYFGLEFLASRYLARIRRPGFFAVNPAQRYSFFHHGEHAPNPDSRVTLSTNRDQTGMLRAHIDFRYQRIDAESITTSLDEMARELSARGIATLTYTVPPEARIDSVLAQANDGFHQIGLARMSDHANDGVTDANARVHGVSNLFIAGSAVFPTSGQANPTLTAVALSTRLAEHLTREFRQLPAPV